MLHHELIQMIDNCAQAAQRNDRDALRSFPSDWPRKSIDSDPTPGTITPKEETIALLQATADWINYLESTVIPAVNPKDLMKLQIELAGFKSSYQDPASPVTSTPANN